MNTIPNCGRICVVQCKVLFAIYPPNLLLVFPLRPQRVFMHMRASIINMYANLSLNMKFKWPINHI